MGTTGKRAVSAVAFAVAVLASTSCTDETVVYRERPIFQEPVEAALDFVGYSDPSEGDKLTVCGNCHIGQQGDWEETAHAFAWEGLQGSGHAQAFCEECHTVNSLGNTVEETEGAIGGYASASDERYHDVQCESCHGPGLPHIRNPDNAENQPMAPITVGADLTFGCGECHSGAHHPFVEEWETSAHANVTAYPAQRGDAAGGCYKCHTGDGALENFGVNASYLEKEELTASDSDGMYAQITCSVCHDPHSNEFEGQLRFAVNDASLEDHLCAQCHDKRSAPEASRQGLSPHSPEKDLLEATAGFFFDGTVVDPGQIMTTHGGERNPRLCAGCHVLAFESTDELTGEEIFSTGHNFRAIPCVDEVGRPTGEENCAMSREARRFDGCEGSGCHSPGTAQNILTASAGSVLDRVQQLNGLLVEVDADWNGGGGPIEPNDAVVTTAEGALFNMRLAHHGSALTGTRQDSLAALAPTVTHNPYLIESLLIASIRAVQNEYGVGASIADSDLQPVLTRPAGL